VGSNVKGAVMNLIGYYLKRVFRGFVGARENCSHRIAATELGKKSKKNKG